MNDFHIEKNIYYHDTDWGGVVYYANYLKYMEEARTEFCKQYGIDMRKLAEDGTLFAIVKIEVNYRAPARYQDTIQVFTRLEKVGRSSLVFIQTVKRNAKVLVDAVVTWACITPDFKPKAAPPQIRKLIS
ncbi:MAG: YbgC/FadM family acyl-CoA thioesterase [PVC group bacterium]|nr:YbgC/FadM family acyl-CoA thioesterase [PVC group bacterium]